MKRLFHILTLATSLTTTAAALPTDVKTEPNGLSSKSRPDSLVLSLQPLVEEALKNNASLKASAYENQFKQAAIGPSGSYQDPMASLEAMNFPVDSLSRTQSPMTGIQVALTQNIPFPGKLSRRESAARHEAEAQKKTTDERRLEIIRDVKVAYYTLFATYKKKDLLLEQKRILEQTLETARNHYQVGKTPQAEVLNLQVEEATTIDGILTAEKEIRMELGELSHLVGRADHESYLGGKPEGISRTPFDFTKSTEPKVINLALKESPILSARAEEVKAAASQLGASKLNYLPDLEFKLGYTFRKPSPLDTRGVDFVSAMVGVTLPLWAGSKQSEERRGAIAEQNRTESLLLESRNLLSHQVHATYAELKEASDRLNLYEGGVIPLVRQSVQVGRASYLTGKLAYATLLNLLNRRLQVETSYYQALATYESKIAELDALTAGGIEKL